MHQIGDAHVSFHDDLDIMEVDFKGVTFATIADANAFYDRVTELCAESGRKWFFLVRYDNCSIRPEAFSTFAARGRTLNQSYSLGSVRCGATRETHSQIGEAANVENFDANLVENRDAALVRIGALRAAWKGEISGAKPTAATSAKAPGKSPYAHLIAFHEAESVMEVDFSETTFTTSAMVNEFYDEIERQAAMTNRKWFFMVNYHHCEIDPAAWMTFAHRGKRLNVGYSLGTVRFDTSDETMEEINRKAATEEFDPNICASRENAMARIAEMRGSLN